MEPLSGQTLQLCACLLLPGAGAVQALVNLSDFALPSGGGALLGLEEAPVNSMDTQALWSQLFVFSLQLRSFEGKFSRTGRSVADRPKAASFKSRRLGLGLCLG